MALLPAPFARVRICQVEIAVELVSAGTAGLVIGLVLVLVPAPEVPSEVDIILIPELILINSALDEVFHFGAPLGPKPHGLDGSFYGGAGGGLLFGLLFGG